MRILLIICLLLASPALVLANNADNRRDRVYGTGSGSAGSVTTYTDPQTGDIVTSVKPARKSNEQNNHQYNQGNVPIYIYPQIAPSWPHSPTPPQP